jgi:acetyltransferase-like isoleucine patch superfamily enzyme
MVGALDRHKPELGQHSWVYGGATVEPQSVLGDHASVGAGSRIVQGCQIEPYSRLGASTATTSSPTNRPPRSAHLANAVENLMRLDRE